MNFLTVTLALTGSMLFFSCGVFADENAAAMKLTWYKQHKPPYFIVRAPNIGSGYADLIENVWKAELNGYDHKSRVANDARFFKDIGEKKQVCVAAVGKFPHIVKKLHWSQPIYLLGKPMAFIRAEAKERIGSPKQISIKKLLSNPQLKFGYIKGYGVYGPLNQAISEHIKKHGKDNEKNWTVISSSAPMISAIAMMKRKRIDWMIELPVFWSWGMEQAEQHGTEEISTIKIQEWEDLPFRMTAFAGCAKDAWGKEVIDKINRALTRKNILKIRAAVQRWHKSPSILHEFIRLNKEHFGY